MRYLLFLAVILYSGSLLGSDKIMAPIAPGLSAMETAPGKGGTVLKEGSSWNVSGNRGDFRYQTDLPELPWRGGFGYKGSLKYEAQSGEKEFGLGWSLQVPSVEFAADEGIPEPGFSPEKGFSKHLTWRGQRLIYRKSQESRDYYAFHPEASETDLEFRYYPEGFHSGSGSIDRAVVLYFPDGRRQIFSGDEETGEGYKFKNDYFVHRWPLVMEINPAGEQIVFIYEKAGEISWLKKISFAGGLSTYTLHYQEHPQARELFHRGHRQVSDRLVTKITAEFRGKVRNQWCLAYSAYKGSDDTRERFLTHPSCQEAVERDQEAEAGKSGSFATSVLLRKIYRYGSSQITEADSLREPSLSFSYTSMDQQQGKLKLREIPGYADLIRRPSYTVPYTFIDLNLNGMPDVIADLDGQNLRFDRGLDFSITKNKRNWNMGYTRTFEFSPDLRTGVSHLVDLNGNSLPDFVRAGHNGFYYSLRKPDGSFEKPEWLSLDRISSLGFGSGSVAFVDLNRSGAADILRVGRARNGRMELTVYRNKSVPDGGPGQKDRIRFEDSRDRKTYSLPFDELYLPRQGLGSDSMFTDLTGDGLPDWLIFKYMLSGFCHYVNRGLDVSSGSKQAPLLFGGNDQNYEDRQKCGSGHLIKLPGLGLEPWQTFDSQRLWILDINGNGIKDIALLEPKGVLKVWLGLGNGTFTDPETLQLSSNVRMGVDVRDQSLVLDIDGDGQDEILLFDLEGRHHVIKFNQNSRGNLTKLNLLNRITCESGLRYEVDYSSVLGECSRDKKTGHDPDHECRLHFPKILAKKVRLIKKNQYGEDSAIREEEISYHKPRYYAGRKKFLGFERVERLIAGDEYLMQNSSSESALIREYYHPWDKTNPGSHLLADVLVRKEVWSLKEAAFGAPVVPGHDSRSLSLEHYSRLQKPVESFRLDLLQKELFETVLVERSGSGPEKSWYRQRTLHGTYKTGRDDITSSEVVEWKNYDGFNLPGTEIRTVTVPENSPGGGGIRVQTTLYDYEKSRAFLGERGIVDRPSRVTGSVSWQGRQYPAREEIYNYNRWGSVQEQVREVMTPGKVPVTEYAPFELPGQRVVRLDYDGFGNIISESDAGGLIRKTGWDDDGVFPVREENAAGHFYSLDYDEAGWPRKLRVPGGKTWTLYRDSLGRLTEKHSSTGEEERLAYKRGENGKPAVILYRVRSAPGRDGFLNSLAAYNSDGQLLAQVESDESGRGSRVLERREYNHKGQEIFRFSPYALPDKSPEQIFSLGTVPEAEEATGLTVSYDPLGREKKLIWPGTELDREGRLLRGRIDQNEWFAWGEQTRTQYHDEHRGLVDVRVQRYLFDGKVTGIADEAGHLKLFNRDYLGNISGIIPGEGQEERRIIQNSEGLTEYQSVPGIREIWQYFDVRGRVILKVETDHNGALLSRLSYTYDDLNRLVSVSGNGGSLREYEYDTYPDPNFTGQSSEGLLTEVRIPGVAAAGVPPLREAYTYDASGRLKKKLVQIGKETFVEHYEYSIHGKLIYERDSQGTEKEISLGRSGRLKHLSFRAPGLGISDWQLLLEEVSYSPKGQLEYLEYHNGQVNTTLSYDPHSLLLTGVHSRLQDGSPVHHLRQSLNGMGSVTGITDLLTDREREVYKFPERSGSFSYNERDELRTFTRYGKDSSFSYNSVGHFIQNDETGKDDLIHQKGMEATVLPALPSGSWEWGPGGNLQKTPDISTLEFNSENRLVKVETQKKTVYFGYNHLGERLYKRVVEKKGGGEQISLFPGKSVHIKGSKAESYIFVGSQRLAKIDHSKKSWYYYLKDQIGSTDLMFASDGTITESMYYQAWGQEVSGSGSDEKAEPYRFTGQFFDDEAGLYYYGARYYSPELGRFISPDPLFLGRPELCVESPVECNLYSYANNNPLKYVDPNGLLTVIIHGTWAKNEEWANNPNSSFLKAVANTFRGDTLYSYNWLGDNTNEARVFGAEDLRERIQNHAFLEGEKFNVVAHSHGGNVAKIYSNLEGARKIDNLITLGTPNRGDYKLNGKMVDNYINAYSPKDPIQTGGGTDSYGARVGFGSRGGEWVLPGKCSEGSPQMMDIQLNLNNSNIFSSHSDTHSPEAWSQIEPHIRK